MTKHFILNLFMSSEMDLKTQEESL